MMPDPTGGGVMIRDYRKGNWTLTETMVLIEAKKMNDDRRMKRINGGGGGSSSSSANKSGELRWKWVEDYCWRKGCFRSQNQCNDKWDNLMRDYKKVRDHQRRLANSSAGEEPEPGGNNNNNKSYWKMEKSERKDRNLPSNMLLQIYDALVHVVERPGGGGSGDQQPPPSGGGGGGSSSSGINASISNVNQVTTMEMSTAIVHQQPPSTSAATAGVLMPLPMLPHHHHPHHQAYLPITTALPLPPPQSTQPPPLHSQPQVGPPPPPPPHLVTHAHHYPIPTTCDSVDLDSDSNDTSGGEYTDSPAKRRRRSSAQTR